MSSRYFMHDEDVLQTMSCSLRVSALTEILWRQEGSLCGVHCVNTLLQGPFFGPVEMSQVRCLSSSVLSHTKTSHEKGKGARCCNAASPPHGVFLDCCPRKLLPHAEYARWLQLQGLKEVMQRALIH